ncbi:MAG: hypothetical protein ACTSQS_14500, partial [Promethearchaeota archaeon]
MEKKDEKNSNKIAKKESLDNSILSKEFLIQRLKEYEIKRMLTLYQKGIVSLQEAATQANITLYEMMEYV